MNKQILIPTLLILGISLFAFKANDSILRKNIDAFTISQDPYDLRGGEIIFQSSQSSLSQAIQLATHSKYSHVGIIFKKGNSYFVYEAVQPVRITPLKEWIERGEGGHFVIKRLRKANNILTPSAIAKMENQGKKYLGKNYDGYFEWSDERIYCSELVWRIYKEVLGLEIGELQKLSEFDLSSPLVKSQIKKRYGNNIPLNEKVISPAAMFNSDLLETILEG